MKKNLDDNKQEWLYTFFIVIFVILLIFFTGFASQKLVNNLKSYNEHPIVCFDGFQYRTNVDGKRIKIILKDDMPVECGNGY